jgi:hypothetical protein
MADPSPRPHSLEPAVISEHEVLRPRECEAVRDQVFALEEHWTSRSVAGSFFTLGVASYLDAVGQREAYVQKARETNPILRANFAWLSERVRKGFEEVLSQPVSYDEECALPGFHIFKYDGGDMSRDKPSSRAHFDLQWMHAIAGARPQETLSFTLPIQNPPGGCSLEIWPVHSGSIPIGFNALKYAASHPSQTVRYTPGRMVVHDGLLLHAIGHTSLAAPKGYRITFQGHGAKVSSGWKLYW